MNDEQSQDVLAEVPNVADGQAVVDAVAQDTQNIVNGAVERMGEMLAAQSESSPGTYEMTLTSDQWDVITEQLRFSATSSMLCAFATMAVFGAVCAGLLVKGWRRG